MIDLEYCLFVNSKYIISTLTNKVIPHTGLRLTASLLFVFSTSHTPDASYVNCLCLISAPLICRQDRSVEVFWRLSKKSMWQMI